MSACLWGGFITKEKETDKESRGLMLCLPHAPTPATPPRRRVPTPRVLTTGPGTETLWLINLEPVNYRK